MPWPSTVRSNFASLAICCVSEVVVVVVVTYCSLFVETTVVCLKSRFRVGGVMNFSVCFDTRRTGNKCGEKERTMSFLTSLGQY